MKKLEKIGLSDAKVMNVQEMKMIVGGQVTLKLCRNTNEGSSGTREVTCEGACPTETVTGNTPPQVCKKLTSRIGQVSMDYCACV